MTDLAIRVENLSKLYRIGQREPYKALRETLSDAMYAPFRSLATVFSGRRSAVVGRPSLACAITSATASTSWPRVRKYSTTVAPVDSSTMKSTMAGT
ncbi:MAG: hypothetical protein AAB393_04040 [Bacteroidota bacterium]